MLELPAVSISRYGELPMRPTLPKTTDKGVDYFQHCGVAMLAKTVYDHTALGPFIKGFASDLGFEGYMEDGGDDDSPDKLVKTAGQLCYLSFSEKRTKDSDMAGYIQNICEQGHGSVFEHSNFSLLFWGIDRSLTHELVRHRAGCAYSQCSQRYTDGKTLRFVERAEFQEDAILHLAFLKRIERASEEYDAVATRLRQRQKDGDMLLSEEARTAARKKVNQVARAVLPNETEAPILMTANARAWRHFLTMRASVFAETAIRAAALKAWQCLLYAAPHLFGDFTPSPAQDGTIILTTPYPKI